MTVFVVAAVITVMSHRIWNSYFCKILAGFLWITAGVVFIRDNNDEWSYIIMGVAIVSIGLYEMLMVAVDIVKGD